MRLKTLPTSAVVLGAGIEGIEAAAFLYGFRHTVHGVTLTIHGVTHTMYNVGYTIGGVRHTKGGHT